MRVLPPLLLPWLAGATSLATPPCPGGSATRSRDPSALAGERRGPTGTVAYEAGARCGGDASDAGSAGDCVVCGPSGWPEAGAVWRWLCRLHSLLA